MAGLRRLKTVIIIRGPINADRTVAARRECNREETVNARLIKAWHFGYLSRALQFTRRFAIHRHRLAFPSKWLSLTSLRPYVTLSLMLRANTPRSLHNVFYRDGIPPCINYATRYASAHVARSLIGRTRVQRRTRRLDVIIQRRSRLPSYFARIRPRARKFLGAIIKLLAEDKCLKSLRKYVYR